jgi:hypothetical protein
LAGILDFRNIRIGVPPDLEEFFAMLYGFSRPTPPAKYPVSQRPAKVEPAANPLTGISRIFVKEKSSGSFERHYP